MIVSFVLKTESGDQYHYLDDFGSVSEAIQYLIDGLGEELAYVSETSVRVLGATGREEDDIRNRVRKAIEAAEEAQ